MKINLFPIVSPLHEGETIGRQTQNLIREIKTLGDFVFTKTPIEELYDGDLAVILVQSGGSEGLFLEMKDRLRAPYYLLTYGTNNSLAASMEILSYLKAAVKRRRSCTDRPPISPSAWKRSDIGVRKNLCGSEWSESQATG